MNTIPGRLGVESQLLTGEASFIEIQLHDQSSTAAFPPRLADLFKGYVTIHGEGETDGRNTIRFCSTGHSERNQYVQSAAGRYLSVIDLFGSGRVRRIILHPSTLSKKRDRNEQLQVLARSLEELKDLLPSSVSMCIEPRGNSRHGKVLRLDLDDLAYFRDSLGNRSGVGLCIDIAQLFVTQGNQKMGSFLSGIKETGLSVNELHLSDVFSSGRLKNRVAMEIGKGAIDWDLVLPDLKATCDDWLIETLGGIPVFRRSKAFLEKMVNQA
jgi:sugar phosphate isomerase/epimerase